MNRAEYLKQRRLSGLSSRIRRVEHQILRGQSQISKMRATFERNKVAHEKQVQRVTERITRMQTQINTMKQEQVELQRV